MTSGILYVVATPIGNLEDITLRALRVLKGADLVFAEDTRVARKLLSHFEIKTPVSPIHTRNEGRAAEAIIASLCEGKSVALTSDSGTPGLSDPGAFVIAQVMENLPEAKILAVPGASALAAAVSVAGIPLNQFSFLGFLPHKKGREKIFKEIAESKRPVILYESPHRILKTLESLEKYLGSTSRREVEPKEKKITICRELAKIHEEVKSGSAAELVEFFKNNPEKVRGEFVVIVSK